MKKNGEYVGVDEKFIPENEKYVDDSVIGDKEKIKKFTTRIAKGYIIFIVLFAILAFGMPIFIFMQGKKIISSQVFRSSSSVKENKYNFSHIRGTKSGASLLNYLDDIIDNNKSSSYATITVVYNGSSAVSEDDLLSIKRSISTEADTVYEISVDYSDSQGRIVNKVTIEEIKK